MFSKKQITSREKKLLVLLPAALVLALYSFLIAVPRQRTIQANLPKLNRYKKTAVTQSQADEAKLLLESEKSALKDMRLSLIADRNRIRQLSGQWRSDASQLNAVQKLTELMELHQLSISSQDYEPDPNLSTYFLELGKIIDAQFPEKPLEYWEVELEGAYTNVVNFLSAIDVHQTNVIPISLTMNASSAGNGHHRWKIIFMI